MGLITEEVYNMLLRALHVTYTPDEDTRQRIQEEGAAGIALIRKYGDPDTDCDPGTRCGELLCEYVRRAEAGAAETFLQDFGQDIVELKNESDVQVYAEAQGYA